ncbi:SDR family NAD(P)-dependent oxidoreductase [Actinomadura rugatobispora]|uniref:SDR family NAD(P)-dependent oxidoreductase n=1 Tax=Actinomadura rugatobispora TaxID=1994 RepID=A0ABW1ACI9_9ACTN|nr:SDR family oxidoreductase [Actinomadura rugatobispora]
MTPLGPDAADLETCLRVLASLPAQGSAEAADPRWQSVWQAVERAHRDVKKARKTARRTERRDHDRAATEATARFRDQDPAPAAASLAAPAQAAPAPSAHVLGGARHCYVCKAAYRELHPEYHMLCPECAEQNLARRFARCDLRGRRAVVTGGRVKIGFQVALKLLRDGAEVLVTTRFPRDAARRFAEVPDAADWLDRLQVHGVDLLDLPGVAGLLRTAHERFDHLDILINNAAQTIRRPAAYHREVRAAEAGRLTGLAARVTVTGDAAGALAEGAPRELEPAGGTAPAIPAPAALPALPSLAGPEPAALEALFPAGRTDETGQPLDLRDRNSWTLRLHEVDPGEWLEVQMVNAFAPFLLTSRLRGLLESSPWPDRYVVQVSAMEGSFSRKDKTVRHPHTNMAKASLNMMTRTAAADFAASGIHMTSVDTGWITDERPHPSKQAQRAAGFRPPLDVIDGAARVYDPVVRGVGGERLSGLFLKDYRPVEW